MHPNNRMKEFLKDEKTGQVTIRFESGEQHAGFDQVVMAIGEQAGGFSSCGMAERCQ